MHWGKDIFIYENLIDYKMVNNTVAECMHVVVEITFSWCIILCQLLLEYDFIFFVPSF